MILSYFDNYEAMSQQAGELLVAEIIEQKNLLLCAATGRSPEGAYKELVRRSKESDIDVKKLRSLSWMSGEEFHIIIRLAVNIF